MGKTIYLEMSKQEVLAFAEEMQIKASGTTSKILGYNDPSLQEWVDQRFSYGNSREAILDLRNINLEEQALNHINFSQAVSESGLLQVHLQDARMSGASMRYGQFYGAKFDRADLTQADLSYADMASAILTNAKLSKSCLKHTDFTAADLRFSNMSETDLKRANFQFANLMGADLTDLKNLRAVKSWKGTLLIGAKMSDEDRKFAQENGAITNTTDLKNAIIKFYNGSNECKIFYKREEDVEGGVKAGTYTKPETVHLYYLNDALSYTKGIELRKTYKSFLDAANSLESGKEASGGHERSFSSNLAEQRNSSQEAANGHTAR